ncbi:MAG: ArsR family transcriptional regulator [Candidatus Thorarchaeota archaeon]|nr:ArsR family transcriptional regulator [Candidatus Thorarchaeota archaeon]
MDKVLNAVSHKIRRQIIHMIGNQGAVSYTDLTELGLEPGTLYFHLDILSKSDDPLIARPGKKLYSLTELGQAAYEIILQSEDILAWLSKDQERPNKGIPLVQNLLSLRPIIQRIQNDPWRFFFEIVLFLGLYGYLASEVGLVPIFLFFLEGTFNAGITILAAFGAWITTYFIVEILSYPILKKAGFSLGLFATIPIAFFPHVLLELMWYFLPQITLISGWPLTILLTFVIAWSTYILTTAVSRARAVRFSRAAIVTLLVTNANLLLLALLNSSIPL